MYKYIYIMIYQVKTHIFCNIIFVLYSYSFDIDTILLNFKEKYIKRTSLSSEMLRKMYIV